MFSQITGRRKTAVAQLFIKTNPRHQGQILIKTTNKQTPLLAFNTYFLNHPLWMQRIKKAITLTKTAQQYDVIVKLKGGGIAAQADAICHGLARFLAKLSPENRNLLKTANLLSRDARVKERKKYGLKKARKAPQFSKR